MQEFLFGLHSGVRYLVLLAALAALIASLAGWRRSGAAGSMERGAMLAFVGLLDLQVLIGLALLTQWPFYGALAGHIVMMVLAAATAHAGSILARRRAPDRPAAPVRAATVVLALILIVGGILAIQRSII
jgi:hypothetical protein